MSQRCEKKEGNKQLQKKIKIKNYHSRRRCKQKNERNEEELEKECNIWRPKKYSDILCGEKNEDYI